jgi:hypothetical protein
MAAISKHLKRLLPRKWRRKLAVLLASKEAEIHFDSNLAQRSLGAVDDEWRNRINAVMGCSDNAHIPRVDNAGELKDGMIAMHNGLRVGALSYYGAGILNMLVENRGVHEPQEERAFAEILSCLPPGGTMIELGAYWGFYSMWFLNNDPDRRALLVEPDAKHLLSGQQNFQKNNLKGLFEASYVGNKCGLARDGTNITTLDELMQRHKLDHLSILHADIQGAEMELLEGAHITFEAGKVDYVFISTHSQELHDACLQKLHQYGMIVLVSCDLQTTVSYDGVIVAKRPNLVLPSKISVEGNSI